MIVKMNIDCSDAIPRQSRIVKQNSEPGDFMKDGEKGTVLDYFKVPDDMTFDEKTPQHVKDVKFCYGVKWDSVQNTHPVFILDYKIRKDE